MPKPEEAIDATKAEPVPAVSIHWSREWKRYIAVAPVIKGVVGVGETFSAAAYALERAIIDWDGLDKPK